MRRMGQRYKNKTDGEVYILAITNYSELRPRVGLISLKHGNRWREPVIINNSHDIRDDEWNDITGLCGEFVRLKGYPK